MPRIEFKGSPDLPGIQVITINHPHSQVECAILLNGSEKMRLGLLPEGMCTLIKADVCPDGVVLAAFSSVLGDHIQRCAYTTLEPSVDGVESLVTDKHQLGNGVALTADSQVFNIRYSALSCRGFAALIVTTRRTVSTVLVSSESIPAELCREIALTLWRHQRGADEPADLFGGN